MHSNDKLAILLDNLKICDGRTARDFEQRNISLYEIAAQLCENADGTEPSELVTRFFELTETRSLADTIPICSALISHQSFLEPIRHAVSVGHDEQTPAGSHSRIAYTKNKYNDLAFESFSEKINGARAHYTSSLADACEAVNDGECEFCILPVRNSIDGRLWGFYSMIDRYGLKICSICSVESIDGISSTDYALIGKFCAEPSKRVQNTARYIFEFSVLSENGDFISELLHAANLCGATPQFIDSRPVEYDVQLCRYIFSFYTAPKDSLLLRLLLVTHYDSYSPIGLYPKNQNY